MYERILADLRESYDRTAQERDRAEISDWKVKERQRFLRVLIREKAEILLEVGSGPGRDGKFFQDQGLEVTCTDLSPEMVNLCREKGLKAHVMGFSHLDFPDGRFDGVYALNCILHVPNKEIADILVSIRRVLKPAGLFYLGVYGGVDFEGTGPEDHHKPKRFFSYRTDEDMKSLVRRFFELEYFRCVELKGTNDMHFQSMILRKRTDDAD